MDDEDVSVGAVQPGEQQELIPGLDASESVEHLRLEAEPGIRRAFVPLSGRGVQVGEGRLHPPDRPQLVGR